MDAIDAKATTEELLKAVFSMRSVPRLYNEELLRLRESLETAARRVGGWCEMAASLGVSSSNELLVRKTPASKDVNIEALDTVTRRQPVRIQQTEKTSYVL
jgi:hypothetical protein